jgi:hypothetical protein
VPIKKNDESRLTDVVHRRHKSKTQSQSYWLNCYRENSIIWDITPCSPLKVSLHFEGACRLLLQGILLAYYSTLSIEATFSSEASAEFQRNTRRYISEDRTLENHRCERRKSLSWCLIHSSTTCRSAGPGEQIESSICSHRRFLNLT